MPDISTEKLVDGYTRAFIDSSTKADPSYTAQLLTNSKGHKVLTSIQKELKDCDSMFISVAFITTSGLTPLLGTLKELQEKKIEGRILTTDYLLFSDPIALNKLNTLGDNIKLKIFKTGDTSTGFHTKGYMFRKQDSLRIIVGSSNLTQDALSKNHEWNTKIISSDKGEFAKDIESEFNDLWESAVNYSEYKDEYTKLYYNNKEIRTKINKLSQQLNLSYSQVLQPNSMQAEFISNVEEIIKSGEKRALLISATGTGKTYASAFALRNLLSKNIFNNQKILFISHREQINKQALKSYKRVLGDTVSMELLSGNHNDVDKARYANVLFSTINMISKDDIIKQFDPKDYSIIVLDECHRTGSKSYQKVIDYFEPEFLLGMSASPQRTDDFDIYALFDHNIACEIRLKQAMENDLLCPFHYFGISDFQIDGNTIDDLSDFNTLTCDDRVNYIKQQAEYYGYSGNRVKGLVFCRSKKEAQELSNKINQLYKPSRDTKYKTTMLSGDDNQEIREDAIERLVNDDINKDLQLDYIFTVDIFNEGVDIPEINQVIMLRPTESPIVFIQQLGRGLRKSENKEFVVIIDFIGNYDNNYMIPIALSGDRTGNKDNIRKHLVDDTDFMTGASSIYFDKISRERIYKAIDNANLNVKRQLKKDYQNFKYRLGHIPELIEFDKNEELDPIRLFNYKDWGSYPAFLMECEPDYTYSFSKEQLTILTYLSRKLALGMRVHELEMLKQLLEQDNITIDEWKQIILENYNIQTDSFTIQSTLNVLKANFFRDGFTIPLIQQTENSVSLSDNFKTEILSNPQFKSAVLDVINFGIERFKKNYSVPYNNLHFNLYKKYTYAQVCWLLNWEKEHVALNIGGYKYDDTTNTFPVFINYNKAEDISASTNYEDELINPSCLTAISKSNTRKDSPVIKRIQEAKENNMTILLFIRKNKDGKESKEFYFLGTMEHDGFLEQFDMPGTKNIPAVKIGYKLHTPIEKHLYDYLTSKEE